MSWILQLFGPKETNLRAERSYSMTDGNERIILLNVLCILNAGVGTNSLYLFKSVYKFESNVLN